MRKNSTTLIFNLNFESFGNFHKKGAVKLGKTQGRGKAGGACHADGSAARDPRHGAGTHAGAEGRQKGSLL